jgi:cytochrome c oxidase subunit 2
MLAAIEPTGALIAVSYAALSVLGIVAAVLVWRSTRGRNPDRDVNQAQLERREQTWLVAVLAILVALLFATIFFTPYGKSAPDGQIVRVVGSQFAWEVEPSTVRAGEPVEFQVHAADVNHGFAVYDPDGALVFQIQAMPEETNVSVATFDEPGTYRILCLEFCGVLHHVMETTLEVTE